ncbi:MAG: class I SAM-dependent methyltransferase [Pseudonocardiaceae bacterium]
MADEIVRAKEVELIQRFVYLASLKDHTRSLDILDLGCGNGFTLATLLAEHPQHRYHGVDFSEDLLAIARARDLPGCLLSQGDARHLDSLDRTFDIVFTERCLINILDADEQLAAIREIARVLRPGGYYLMIEGFLEGLSLNNKARQEVGLEPLKEAFHNRYFSEDIFTRLGAAFEVIPPAAFNPEALSLGIQNNFLSSHYFIARVLHPLVTKGEWIRNTEFVRFFSTLPPSGDYSPIKAFILRRRGS